MKKTFERTEQEPISRTGDDYSRGLRSYLEGAGELGLQRAYEIGRSQLAAGVGVIELARMHHTALERILADDISPEEQMQKMKAAADFLAEAASPFEMAYLGFREASFALRHFNDMLESEAKRIAHALHAESSQLLVAVYIALEEMTWNHPRAKPQIEKVRELLDKIEEQLRRLSHELRPAILDDQGLIAAIRYLADGISQRTGLAVTMECADWGDCSPALESALYRIVHEALNNISNHARATRARVTLAKDGRLIRCSVRDNGVGFDADVVRRRNGEHGFGLIGIRERVNMQGGDMQIISSPGHGTELLVTIPLED